MVVYLHLNFSGFNKIIYDMEDNFEMSLVNLKHIG